MTMNPRAFTLVETLIAITVLSFAIIGPFYVSQSVLASSYQARDELAATALAQEGMEYVRTVRDSNFLYDLHNGGSRSWFYGLDGNGGPVCYGGNGCVVDVSQQNVAGCKDSTCSSQPLHLSSAGLYNQQGSGPTTRFTRQVRLTAITATSTQVTVTVRWTNHGSSSVTLTETLMNWL